MDLLVCFLVQFSFLKAKIQHSVQRVWQKLCWAWTHLTIYSLRRQHQFPPEPPQTAGPHLRGPRRGPPPSCSVLWLSAPTVRPLCSVQPVASRPPCRWSSALGAPGPGPRASAPRLHLPVLTSSPPRQVLCRPGADPSPSPGPFVSHPPCVRGPAPTAFLLACKHGLFSSVKHKPTRSWLTLSLSPASPCTGPSALRPGCRAALVPSPLVPLCSGRDSALRLRGRSPQRVWSVVILPPRAAASDTDRCQVLKHCRAKAPVGPAYLVFLLPLGRFFLSLSPIALYSALNIRALEAQPRAFPFPHFVCYSSASAGTDRYKPSASVSPLALRPTHLVASWHFFVRF